MNARRQKKIRDFVAYLRETLIPDLNASYQTEHCKEKSPTAEDFEEACDYIEELLEELKK